MEELPNIFCSRCGSKLFATAIICPSCGSPTNEFPLQASNTRRKSKSTAVVLAALLGVWSFLYTHKLDSKKFWLLLPLQLILLTAALTLPIWAYLVLQSVIASMPSANGDEINRVVGPLLVSIESGLVLGILAIFAYAIITQARRKPAVF